MGKIARSVLARCQAFDIKEAIYYDKFHPIEPAEKMGCKFRPLDEVLANADFIVTLVSEPSQNPGELKALNKRKLCLSVRKSSQNIGPLFFDGPCTP